jgi:hypothetical protein
MVKVGEAGGALERYAPWLPIWKPATNCGLTSLAMIYPVLLSVVGIVTSLS